MHACSRNDRSTIYLPYAQTSQASKQWSSNISTRFTKKYVIKAIRRFIISKAMFTVMLSNLLNFCKHFWRKKLSITELLASVNRARKWLSLKTLSSVSDLCFGCRAIVGSIHLRKTWTATSDLGSVEFWAPLAPVKPNNSSICHCPAQTKKIRVGIRQTLQNVMLYEWYS